MQLGAHRASLAHSRLAEELASEASNSVPGGWDAGDDLIDVAADAGDWSEFASAPGAPQMEASLDPEAWGDMLDATEQQPRETSPSPLSAMPNLSAFAPIARKASAPVVVAKANIPPTSSSLSLPIAQPRSRSSPSLLPSITAASPPRKPSTTSVPEAQDTEGWDNTDGNWDGAESSSHAGSSALVPLAGMSKEDKAAEMARRREERKQRIAQLKEQKKAGGKG